MKQIFFIFYLFNFLGKEGDFSAWKKKFLKKAVRIIQTDEKIDTTKPAKSSKECCSSSCSCQGDKKVSLKFQMLKS